MVRVRFPASHRGSSDFWDLGSVVPVPSCLAAWTPNHGTTLRMASVVPGGCCCGWGEPGLHRECEGTNIVDYRPWALRSCIKPRHFRGGSVVSAENMTSRSTPTSSRPRAWTGLSPGVLTSSTASTPAARPDAARRFEREGRAITRLADGMEQVFERQEFPRLRLFKLSSADWIVRTPWEFGAVNWVLWIEFSGDTVAALRVRIEDSKKVRPEGAPLDVVPRGPTTAVPRG